IGDAHTARSVLLVGAPGVAPGMVSCAHERGRRASPYCVCTAPLSAPRPGRRLGSPAEGSTYWIVIGGLGSCTPDLAFWVHCTTTCRGVKYFGCCFSPEAGGGLAVSTATVRDLVAPSAIGAVVAF